MHHHGFRLAALALILAGACGGEEIPPTCLETGTCALQLEAGEDQSTRVGLPFQSNLSVRILDADLLPASGIAVTWGVVMGGGSVASAQVPTNADGISAVAATAGTAAGPQIFEAAIASGATVRFALSANPDVAETVTIVGGDMQPGAAGAPLPMPLRVQVTDQFGNGVEMASVVWAATAGGGMIEPSNTPTDAMGFAEATATVGQRPGLNLFRARAEGVSGGTVNFMIEAGPGPSSILDKVSGDEQAGIPGQRISAPFVVRVTDRFGNPVEGETVSFSLVTGMGSELDTESAVTDPMGEASAQATLGLTPGEYLFAAQSGMLNGSPQTFRATAVPPICSPDNWCWQSPLPQGNTMFGTWGPMASQVWAVGTGGTILRWNGSAWESTQSGTQSDLHSVYGAGENTAFAVGSEGVITRWDGSAWRAAAGLGTDLNGVWMASETRGFAVGDAGTLLTFDGSVWTPQTPPTMEGLNAVFGFSDTDVFAVGERGTVLRFDGTTWRALPFPLTTDLNGVWGASNDAVWLVGDQDSIFLWDGTEFQTIAGSSPQPLRGVWGRSATEVYAYGNAGRVRRFDGDRWRLQNTPTGSVLYGMSAVGEEVLAVGEDGTFVRLNGGSWSLEAPRRLRPLQGIWGTDANNAWAVGGSEAVMGSGIILRWDGRAWTEVEGVSTSELLAVTGSTADDIWAVGQAGTIVRWNGTEWRSLVSPVVEPLNAVWPISANDAFAVGEAGNIIRWDGTRWSTMTSTVQVRLTGVYGASADEVWAVGEGGRDPNDPPGTLLRFDGSQWNEVASPAESFLQGIRGLGRDVIYAWGTSGTIVRYDGSRWTPMTTGTTETIFAVWPFSRTEAIAVGEDGTILTRTSSTTFQAERSGTEKELFGVWGASPEDIWIVGDSSTILRNASE